MLTHESYISAWGLYLGAGAFAMILFWWLIRNVQSLTLRVYLWVTVLVIAFTPAYSDPERGLFAPAIMAAVLGVMSSGAEEGLPAALVLGFALLGAYVLATVFAIVRFIRKQRRRQEAE